MHERVETVLWFYIMFDAWIVNRREIKCEKEKEKYVVDDQLKMVQDASFAFDSRFAAETNALPWH